MRSLLLAAVAALAACSSSGSQPAPDYYVSEIGVKVESTQQWVTSPDLPTRMLVTIDAAAAHVGASRTDLRGWVVVFTDVDSQCSGDRSTEGCAHFAPDLWISVNASVRDCVEQSVLVHEVIHAIIGDPCHRDDAWRDLYDVESALRATDPTRSWPTPDCPVTQEAWREPSPTC